MSMIGRFFGLPVMAAIFCLVGMMGNAFAVIVDGVEYPFSLTTGSTTFFYFSLSAKGTFYVDCGSGGTLSGTPGVSGGTITRQSSTEGLYLCSYPDRAPRTIRFGGTAIGYNTSGSAAISFAAGSGDNLNLTNLRKITSISGDLSAIFPYMTENPANGEQPKFYNTFSFTDNLTVIPSTLFSGYTTGASGMFYATFWNSKGISSIPSNLFANITTGASNTFNKTFYGCTGLSGYVPSTLFSGLIANGSPYATGGTGMMNDLFANTGLATECPAGTTQYITGYEQYWNGKVSCQPSSGGTTGQDETNPTTYTITYKTGNCAGNTSVVAMTDTATDGVAYSLSPNANTYMNNHIKTGYNFVGWNTATNQQNANVGANWTPTADTTLYAACAPKKYTVTYKVGSHAASGVVDFPDTNGATYDANYSALTGGTSGSQTGIYPADGWTFAGWSTNANPTFNGDVLNNQFTGANPWHTDSNLTVYAAYKQIPPTAVCTVTYNCNGVITTEPYYTSSFSVNSGCDALADGRTFTHWIDDNGGEVDAGATYSCNGATATLTGQYTEIDNPGNQGQEPVITGTTVACAAGKYLPKNGNSSADCTNCESGYFCPRDGNYVAGASVAQGRYSCLPGGVQNGDRKSCRVVLDKSQLLYGLSSGEECWQKTNTDDYVECMMRDVHRVE